MENYQSNRSFFSRLQPAAWVAIFIVLAVIGWFVYSKIKTHDAHGNPIAQTESRDASESANNDNREAKPTSSRRTSTVTIDAPDEPVNGVYKGVVEVGASGFNSFVVQIDNQKRWKIVNKAFGESLVKEGLATSTDIQEGLRKYLSDMANKGVSGKNLHFVISSGALKEPKAVAIANEVSKKGFVVNKVTAEQEGKFAAKAALPPKYRSNSFVVDIGSGNTKISWYEGSQIVSLEGKGAKYYEDGLTDDRVYSEIKALASRVPDNLRENCFMIGGAPYSLAKQTRSGDERYTALNDPSEYDPKNDVKTKSGLNIYKAIKDATGTKNFVFDWDANFTIGFLLSL